MTSFPAFDIGIHGHQRNDCTSFLGNQQNFFINDYNPALLFHMGANIDVQYIGDSSWSLAKYVTSYMTKAGSGEIAEIWNELTNESLHSRLWSLGLKSLTHRQCGAYEAADRLLSSRLYGKSVSIRFVNTNLPHERRRHLKPIKQLQDLKKTSPNSEDIFTNSYLDDYYPNRPEELETISLFEFMKWYDRMPECTNQPTGWLSLQNHLGALRKKTKPYIINHVQHNPNKSDQEKDRYYHAMVMFVFFKLTVALNK